MDGDLLRQDLQVWFRYRGEYTQEKVEDDGDDQVSGPAHFYAHSLTHGGHGHIHTQSKEAHAADEQNGA